MSQTNNRTNSAYNITIRHMYVIVANLYFISFPELEIIIRTLYSVVILATIKVLNYYVLSTVDLLSLLEPFYELKNFPFSTL